MIKASIIAESTVSQVGLESVLKQHTDIEVVSSFLGLRDWIQLLGADSIDVWLIEKHDLAVIELQELNALALEGSMPFIVCITHAQPTTLRQLLALGIRGILPFAATAAEIIAAIRAAGAGLAVVHADFQHELFDHELLVQPDIEGGLIEPLTPREQEVLSLLSQGLTNKAIALELNLSEHTVKFHMGSIFEKLRVSSRTEAVSIGIRQGLILL